MRFSFPLNQDSYQECYEIPKKRSSHEEELRNCRFNPTLGRHECDDYGDDAVIVCDDKESNEARHSGYGVEEPLPVTQCRQVVRRVCGPRACPVRNRPVRCWRTEKAVTEEVPVENW